MRLIGSDSSAVIAELRPKVAVYCRRAAPSEFQHRRVDGQDAHYLLDDLARAGGRTVCDEVDRWRIAAIVQTAFASVRSGHIETVPDLSDAD